MNRRNFLSTFATAAAALVLDPERLLWVPGKKLISVPAPPKVFYEAIVFHEKYFKVDMEFTEAELASMFHSRDMDMMAGRWADGIDAHFTEQYQDAIGLFSVENITIDECRRRYPNAASRIS